LSPLRPILRLVVLLALALALPAASEPPLVGVSWSNFQEERWQTDAAALRDGIHALGGRYIAADAQSSTEKQAADIESLIARGVDVLVVVAHDAEALRPALSLARAEGIPVIAYDRLIEAPGILYLSFDNREVGRMQARELLRQRPSGNYVYLKGSPQDPNSDFVHSGQAEVLAPAIERGRIRIVGDQYVEAWLPERAQTIMEQILTANANEVDAVVCSNDAMAGGVVAALAAQGLDDIPVSGQDGDRAALNRVARGQQAVSVWKDARRLGRQAARAAAHLAAGREASQLEHVQRWSGGPRGIELHAILLEPVPITRRNLDVVLQAGWATREDVCRGTDSAPPPACRAGSSSGNPRSTHR